MSYKRMRIFILAGALLQMTACYKNELSPPANTHAYLSFINTSPFLGSDGRGSATAVRALVEANGRPDTGDLLISYNFIYPEPNKYLPFTAGDWKVSFKDSTRSPLVAGNITTRAGSYYSAVLADSLQHYTAVLAPDDYVPVTGKALVRVLHFSPDAGEVVLYRDTEKLESFGEMHFKQVTPYTQVEPGTNFSFIIRKNDGSGQRVARYFIPSLVAGGAYTLLLKGYMAPPDGDIAGKNSQIVFFRN